MGQSSPVELAAVYFLTRNTASVANNSRDGATAGLVDLSIGLTKGAGALHYPLLHSVTTDGLPFGLILTKKLIKLC